MNNVCVYKSLSIFPYVYINCKVWVVKDERLRRQAVSDVCEVAEALGFATVGVVKSPIEGGDGNVEFLAHFKKEGERLEKDNPDT